MSVLTARAIRAASGASEIALETRIIPTADVFDALTADRPYRPAMPVSKAMKIMARSLDTSPTQTVTPRSRGP